MEIELPAERRRCLRTPIAQAQAIPAHDADAEIACSGHGEPLRRDAAAALAGLERP